MAMTVARPPIVSQTVWDAALAALTEREVTVASAMHQLAAARKRMPMVRVEHDTRFEGPDGQRSLPELFDGRSQLILYRFYFEEGVDGWPDAGVRRLLVRGRRPSRPPTPPRSRHHLRHGLAGTAGEPTPVCRAHGLD
jgi:hypothetical protein